MANFVPTIPKIPFPNLPLPSPKPPLPTPDPELPWFFIRIIKKLASLIGGSKRQDKNSTAEDVNKIQEILEAYKDQMHKETAGLETSVIKEVNFYVEELNDIFEQKQDLFVRYKVNAKRIERSLQRLVGRLQGSIDNFVGRKVSLDNAECRKILQMIPGNKKEEEMNAFLNKAMREALEQYCKEFRQGLSEIFEEVEEEILQAVEDAGQDAVRQSEILDGIDPDNYVEKTQDVILHSVKIVSLCDIVSGCLEVE